VDRDEALKLLTGGPEGVAKWNAWRERLLRSKEPLPDLTRANLARANLTRANLTDANLTDANLAGANLADANLRGAGLAGANLAGANLHDADLRGAGLHDANLTGANLHDADLFGANLTKASLTDTNLRNADLTLANLPGANLRDADLTRANLTDADLFTADLSDANLTGTNLDGIDGRFLDFSPVRLVTTGGWWRFTQFLTWQKVRAVGELQILTKVSYTMLALVPILVGVWQGVKVWVNQTKHEVSHAARELDQTVDARRAAAPEPVAEELKKIRAATSRLEKLIDRDLDPKLPAPWAVGFFAALFVVGGHFVYQLRCPELVADQTPDKFAADLLAAFSSEAPDRNDRLTRAMNALKELAERDPARRHRNLVLRHGRVVWIPSRLDLFEVPPGAPGTGDDSGAPKEPPKEPPPPSAPAPQSEAPPPAPIVAAGPGLMRVAIEEGARAEYELAALRDRGGAALAFGLYVIAAVLIAWLVGSQSLVVGRAAGWWG
jgi:hypothetical protein